MAPEEHKRYVLAPDCWEEDSRDSPEEVGGRPARRLEHKREECPDETLPSPYSAVAPFCERSTAAANGRIYDGLNNMPGVFVGNRPFQEPENPHAAPTAAKFVALSQDDGSIAWFRPKAPTWGTTAVTGRVVFNGDYAGVVTAYDSDSGDILWAFEAGAPIMGGISVAAGMIFFGTGFGFSEHTETGSPEGNPLSLTSNSESHLLYGLAPITR